MHTIVLATQKGGSGKSTLAVGLALAARNAGHHVRLIETDPQGTLSNWQSRRGGAERMVETIYNVGRMEARLEQLDREGVTLVVIDTASGVSAITAAAIRCADLCLIPSRPTVTDIESSATTLKAVRAWRKPFAYVLNQTPVRGRRIDEAANTLGGEDALDMDEMVARPFISMRNDHQDALASGLAVSEYAPNGKSAEEICSLWRWAEARLSGGVQDGTALSEIPVPALLAPATTQDMQTVAAQSLAIAQHGSTWGARL